MRKILVISITAILLLGCKKDEFKAEKYFPLKPGISLSKFKSNSIHLTPGEIVRQTNEIVAINPKVEPIGILRRGFANNMRDTVNNRLLMLTTDIIGEDGKLYEYFIESRDIVLERMQYNSAKKTFVFDTIAYIPNRIIIDAEKRIRAAYASGNRNLCYEIMDNAFIFYPITGEEWRETEGIKQ